MRHFWIKLSLPVLLVCILGIEYQNAQASPDKPIPQKMQSSGSGQSNMNRCGSDFDASTSSFRVNDYWHGLTQCFRQLRDIWRHGGPETNVSVGGEKFAIRDLVRNQILAELKKPYVGFFREQVANTPSEKLVFSEAVGPDMKVPSDIQRVALLNSKGLPYNGMGQSGFAYMLYFFSKLSKKVGDSIGNQDANFYRSIALLSVNTLLTDTEKGGLATTTSCSNHETETCSWFHSITRRDWPASAGGTLNQDLHVIRDLGLIADAMTDKADAKMKKRIDQAVSAGVNQLIIGKGRVSPGTSPNMANYLSAPVGTGHVQWLYYGMNVSSKKNNAGYFLDRKGKDCMYHVHVLNLLNTVLERADKYDYLPNEYKSCSSPVAAAYRTIHIANNSPGNRSMWTANNGRDYECGASTQKSHWRGKFLDKLYGACPIAQ